jgi:hypothetical protein
MKNIKLIDILPTLFGSVAVLTYFVRIPGFDFAAIMLYGGSFLALVTAIISVKIVPWMRPVNHLYYVNIAWIAVTVIYLISFIYYLYLWSNIKF